MITNQDVSEQIYDAIAHALKNYPSKFEDPCGHKIYKQVEDTIYENTWMRIHNNLWRGKT